MIFNPEMPSELRCPVCHSEDIIEFDDYIHCLSCKLEFFTEFLGSDIDEENILSTQELKGFAESFSDEERERLLKSFKTD